MSDIKTNWIIGLIDRVTKPLKRMKKSTNRFIDGILETDKQANFTGKSLRKAFTNAKKYVADTTTKLKEAERELSRLNKEASSAMPGAERAKANRAYQQQKLRVQDIREQLKGANDDLENITSQVNKAERATESWVAKTIAVNQAVEVVEKVGRSLDFATNINKLTTQVERMTDLSGESLDEYVRKSRRIAAVYEEDADKVARAANTMTQQLGGSYEENFRLIEDGFKKGANINGDFLDQLLEYPAQMREMGAGAADMVSIIAQAGKDGVWSDKAMDSMKEGGLSLREMGQAQIDALSGIGIEVKDLEGKTTWQAIQMVSKAMNSKELSTQAKQMALTDIFKGAGEDGGRELIEGFAKGIIPLDDLPEVEETASGFKGIFSDLTTWAGQKLGNFAVYAQQLVPFAQTLTGLIPIMGWLRKSTMLQTVAIKALTVAQQLLNGTFKLTPIGWVILGITALVSIITVCWNKFEGFRTVIYKGWEAIKLFGSAIKDYVIERLKGVLSGVSGVGKAIMHFFEGDWKKAWETGKLAVSDFSGNSAEIGFLENIKTGLPKAFEEGQRKSNQYTARKEAEKKAKEEADSGFSVNNYLAGNAPTLGFENDEKEGKGKDKGKKKTEQGLSVAGGGGGKIITMNLTINNHIDGRNRSSRAIADEIAGRINDRIKDALIA